VLQDQIQTIEIQPEHIKFQRHTPIGEDGATHIALAGEAAHAR
jgi:hypothetical protein